MPDLHDLDELDVTPSDMSIFGLPNPLAVVGADSFSLSPVQERFLLALLLSGSNHHAAKVANVKRDDVIEWLKDEEFAACYRRVNEPELMLSRSRELISVLASIRHLEFLSSEDKRDRRWAVETAYRSEEMKAKAQESKSRTRFEDLRAQLAERMLNDERPALPGGDGVSDVGVGPD